MKHFGFYNYNNSNLNLKFKFIFRVSKGNNMKILTNLMMILK